MYVVFLEQRKRTEMWRVSWVGGCGGRELPWQMKRCHHWKCAGAWSFFFLSPDNHGCRWGIAKPYSIRSRLKERICWEVHFSQMRANPHFRDGRSLDKAVADMALPSADNGFTLWGYRRNRESAPGVDHLPRRGPQGWWRGWKTELAISADLKWFEDAACCLGFR